MQLAFGPFDEKPPGLKFDRLWRLAERRCQSKSWPLWFWRWLRFWQDNEHGYYGNINFDGSERSRE